MSLLFSNAQLARCDLVAALDVQAHVLDGFDVDGVWHAVEPGACVTFVNVNGTVSQHNSIAASISSPSCVRTGSNIYPSQLSELGGALDFGHNLSTRVEALIISTTQPRENAPASVQQRSSRDRRLASTGQLHNDNSSSPQKLMAKRFW